MPQLPIGDHGSCNEPKDRAQFSKRFGEKLKKPTTFKLTVDFDMRRLQKVAYIIVAFVIGFATTLKDAAGLGLRVR